MIIKVGPLMMEYGDCFGAEHEDVRKWVSDYVNGPWTEPLLSVIEPTEKERLEAIKGYIEAMLNDSISRRIKREMADSGESKRDTLITPLPESRSAAVAAEFAKQRHLKEAA